jgi:C-terminal processing protease CtpA/Prc
MSNKWLKLMAPGAIIVLGSCLPLLAQQPAQLPPPTVAIGPALPAVPQLPTLPGIEQLRLYMFPALASAPTEKGAKAYFKQIVKEFADRDFIFMDTKTGKVDTAARDAYLKRWQDQSAKLSDTDYEAADDLGELAMEDLMERFNYFLRPDDVKQEKQRQSSTAVGIGVHMELENVRELLSKLPEHATERAREMAKIVSEKHRLILHPIPKSPAEAAGIKDGDVVLEIDGEKVMDGKHTQLDVFWLMKGKKGSNIELVVQRQEEFKFFGQTVSKSTVTKTISVTRQDVSYPVTHLTPADKDHIVVIKLDTFGAFAAYDEVKEMVNENVIKPKVEKGVPVKMILDLRDNPGGFVDHGVNILGLFLYRGTMLTIKEREGDNIRTKRWTATPDAISYTYPAPASPNDKVAEKLIKRTLMVPEDVPLVVLVNHNSWSCSELVSKSLQANGRAKVCGENTGGKGVVNRPVTLKPGSGQQDREIEVGIGRFYPGDVEVDWEGVHPDLVSKWIEPTKDGEDNQLDDAKKLVLQEYDRIEGAKAATKKLRDETVAQKKAAWQEELKARAEWRRQEAQKKADEKAKANSGTGTGTGTPPAAKSTPESQPTQTPNVPSGAPAVQPINPTGRPIPVGPPPPAKNNQNGPGNTVPPPIMPPANP